MSNEEEEEEDDDDNPEKNDHAKEKRDEEDANVHKFECEKSIPCKDEVESNGSTKIDDKSCVPRSVNQEVKKQTVTDDKKRKKDSKSEKSKNIKKQYDQDVHSEDYSTWIPPQGQSGDGRTNLNDKYGY